MFSARNAFMAGVAKITDLLWKNVTLLVKNVGLSGTTNNTFYDDGPYNFLPTRNGDVTQGSFSPFSRTVGDAPPQIGGSVWFDGTGDYLSLPSSTAVAYGTGDFTVEFWAYPTSNAGSLFVSGYNGTAIAGVNVGITNSTSLWWLFGNGSAWDFERRPTYSLSLNTWHHFAVTRMSGTAYLYVDGALVDSVANTTNFGSSAWYVGASASAGYNITGNVSNVRIVKGTALYTAAFKPPTAPLTAISGTSLLTCQSATAITDASSNAFTVSRLGDARAVSDSPFGYGSVYFDGSGDYLTVPDNTALQMGTGDFTMECWYYPTSFPSSTVVPIFDKGFDSNGVGVQINSINRLNAYIGGVLAVNIANPFSVNTWNHLAISRNGTNFQLFVNGQLLGSYSSSANLNTTRVLEIGYSYADGTYTYGYISNFRVVKGAAVYTAAFTPPTAPLTAISGTSLLTCQDKGSIVDASTNSFAVSRVGDAKPVGMTPFAQKAAGYWSNYFDGTSDYFTVPADNALAFGTGDFTIELWANFSSTYDDQALFDSRPYLTQGAYPLISWYNGALNFAPNATSYTAISGGSITAGKWYHIAVCRSGSSTKMFLNGAQIGSTFNDSLNYVAGRIVFGSNGYSNADRSFFNGYLSNVRFIKGTALYTSNFTPPADPLTAVAGTSLLTCRDNRLIDNSGKNFTLTRYGDVSVSRLNPFGPSLPAPTVNLASAGSVYFDGSGDWLNISSNAAFGVGTGDFTLEGWINPNNWSSNISTVFEVAASGGLYLGKNGSNFVLRSYATADILQYATMPTVGAWTHIAAVRSGTTVSMYFNGVRVATGTSSQNFASGAVQMGEDVSNGTPFAGYMSNFRLVKGTAVYDPAQATLTVPTSPLTAISGTSLLTAQDAVAVTDASSNAFTVTRVGDAKAVEATPFKRVSTALAGSGYFDGNGDYLLIPDNPAFRLGSGDYTVEAWICPNAVTNSYTQIIVGTHTYSGAGDRGWLLGLNPSGKAVFGTLGSSGSESLTESGTRTPGQWVHLAAVRRSGTLTLYVNGVSAASGASSMNENWAAALKIGSDEATSLSPNIGHPGTCFSGYIANVRIVKGNAVYGANFTPPVAPVDAVGGTSLLLNFDNAGIYDGSGNNDMQTVGDTKTSTAVTKFSPGTSTYFDGSGDYLKFPASQGAAFGTGDFTVEAWINVPNISQIGGIAGLYTGGGWNFQLRSGPIYWGNGDTVIATSSANVPINTWTHVAVCRSGTSLRLFIDGTQSGSTATDTINYSVVSTLTVGAISTAPTWPFLGYIQDLRITKSARYTTTFTPPSTEFPTTAT